MTTPRPYRALVLDDDEKWRKILHKSLSREGFVVDTVISPSEMEVAIENSLYHLLVFDISMDGTRENRSGLDLLSELHEHHRTDSCVVVIVSSHETPERSREGFRKYKVNDTIEKQKFDNLAFVKQVTADLDEHIRINRLLSVEWNGPPDAASDVLVNLRIRGVRVKKDTALHRRLLIEFDDLLARVFHAASSIVVTPMQRGHSGAGVVRVDPFYDGGGGRPVVLKFGDVTEIQTEKANYDRHVKLFLGGGRSTEVICNGQTPLLGGIGYALMGTREFESFTSFYRHASVAAVEESLKDLFLSTSAPWYTNLGYKKAVNLTEQYLHRFGYTEESLSDSMHKIGKHVRVGPMITFESLPEKLVVKNPLKAAFKGARFVQSYECTTHGDLNDGNILIDRDGKTWLIDFFHTGPGHALRDFIFLDVALRCCLTSEEEASMQERLKLERTLLEATNFDYAGNVTAMLDSTNEHMQKAFASSLRIRALAAKQVKEYVSFSTDSMRDYFIGSCFYALGLTRFSHLDAVQREHALLSAALTAEYLQL